MSEKKELKKALTPFHLWIIAVGMVISGHYFGWNFGLAEGGYVGMLIAIGLMALMYTGMVLCITELAVIMPYAGGPYSFARRAMGPVAGFLTGVGVILEYVIAAPVVAIGIGGYINFLFPQVNPVLSALVMYLIFITIHIIGIKEYATIETIIVVIALGLLVIMYAIGFPNITKINIFGEGKALIPGGFSGVWACLPYAMWLFLAIELLPMLSEECIDAKRDMPKGLIYGISTLLVLSVLTSTVAIGLGGYEMLSTSGNPLPDAVANTFGKNYWLAKVLASVGLLGLIASFSGVILGYSRQIFALSRAGYLPGFLSNLSKTRRTPHWALIWPGILGLVLVMLFNADDLILLATFGALISYIMMCLSCIILRKKEPNLVRPYKVPLFPVLPVISIILAAISLFSSIFAHLVWFYICVGVFALAVIYYYAFAKNNINPDAPEEQMANGNLD